MKHKIVCGSFSYGMERLGELSDKLIRHGHEITKFKVDFSAKRSSYEECWITAWSKPKRKTDQPEAAKSTR